jgi:hypothetical protein
LAYYVKIMTICAIKYATSATLGVPLIRQLVTRVLSVFCEPLSLRWGSAFDVGSLAGELPPLGERRAALFVGLAINDMAFRREMIVDVGMDRSEFL